MSKKLNPDRELIVQKYVVENKSLKLTAKELGMGRTTLSRYLKRYKIEKRDRYELHKKIFFGENNPSFKHNLHDKILIKEYLGNNKKSEEVAKIVGCSKWTVLRNLRKYNIKIRTNGEAHLGLFVGTKSPRWIDGRSYFPYPQVFNKHLKDKIRQRDNYTCQNCLMTEDEHWIVFGTNLHTHHIDYCKENCQETNLIALCNGCNTRANYNRDYWQSFFQNKIGQIKHDNI